MPQRIEIKIGNSQDVGEALAVRTTEAIRKKQTYTLACSKGNSVKDYYSAFREHFSRLCHSGLDIKAFSIDEELGTTKGLDFLRENMPPQVKVYGINARFTHEGNTIDNETLRKILEENPQLYARNGRAIKPLSSKGIFGELKSAADAYDNLHGRIDCALIGLGVDPIHIGSNFPPTLERDKTHLGEKLDNEGRVIGYAMTLGIRTLASAEEVILFAAGRSKAEGVKRTLESPMYGFCPPSYLKCAKSLILALDYDSASLLDRSSLDEKYKGGIIWS